MFFDASQSTVLQKAQTVLIPVTIIDINLKKVLYKRTMGIDTHAQTATHMATPATLYSLKIIDVNGFLDLSRVSVSLHADGSAA